MDFNTFLSSLITSSNCNNSDAETNTSCQILSNDQELLKRYETLTMNETNSKLSKFDTSEPTSPSQVSPNLPSECQSSLFSVGSTDLSAYLVSGSSANRGVDDDNRSVDDDETATDAESIATIAESRQDKTKLLIEPSQTSNPSSNRIKLIRSNSFTVETPSFKNLPSCDSSSSTQQKPTVNSFSAIGANDNRLPKMFLPVNYKKSQQHLFETQFMSPNSSFGSPVVSSNAAQKTVQLLQSEDFDDFDVDKIEEQVRRLKDMQIMLAEYHKLQMDHLNVRQRSEVETLKTQVMCMEKILFKLKSSINESNVSNDHKIKSIENYRFLPPKSFKTSKKFNSNQTCRFSPSRRPVSSVILFTDGIIPDVLKQKLGAFVKGFLLRRFMKVPKVDKLVTTLKDVRQQLITLSKEKKLNDVDYQFVEILLLQLTTGLDEFHMFIFDTSVSEKMALIANHRLTLEKQTVQFSASVSEPLPKKLSSATLKRLTSRFSSSSSPKFSSVSPKFSSNSPKLPFTSPKSSSTNQKLKFSFTSPKSSSTSQKSASYRTKVKRWRNIGKEKYSTKSPRKSPTSTMSAVENGRQSRNSVSFSNSISSSDKKPWR